MLSPRSLESWGELLRDLESELAEPRIAGIPIGSTLTDPLVTEFINGDGRWGLGRRLMDRLRKIRSRIKARRSRAGEPAEVAGRVLVIWRVAAGRTNDLLRPVVNAIGAQRCAVAYSKAAVLPHVPAGAMGVNLLDTVPHDPSAWSATYRRCWPEWSARLKRVCRKHGLPGGAFERLSRHVLLHSQWAMGCAEFLRRQRPDAILAEHDRSSLSSCLVLAARTHGIPTFTLQHGVIDGSGVGYTPVLADKMFCWGEFDRAKLIAAGDDPGKLVLGGCPRLSRELSATRAEGRLRLGLDSAGPVVLLGTAPVSPAVQTALAELFCRAVERLDGVSAVVRLHPSERLASYEGVASLHPRVRFTTNLTATLDEALAAADVVVVHCSGLGGDAIVKRRPVVVLDIEGSYVGHGEELVRHAGCPRAATPEELAVALQKLLFDESQRTRQTASAERFLDDFCCAYGADSASRIAEFIAATIAEDAGRGVR